MQATPNKSVVLHPHAKQVFMCNYVTGSAGMTCRDIGADKQYYVDRGSLSTNHKLASQNSSNADVSTAGLQFSSGQTSDPEENCSPAVETSAFDEFCEANLWLVEREPRST